MSNKAIRIIAIAVALMSIVCIFAACSGGNENSEELIFKKNGKIYFRKEANDNAYELVTDANGETVVDEQGNLLWKVTDADGKEQTHPVSFPGYLQDGKKVSCQQFTISIPRGWENIGHNMIMLRDTKSSKQIDYSFFTPDEDGNVPTAESRAKALTDLLKTEVEKGNISVKQENVQIGGRDAIKVVMDNSGSEKQAYAEVYYISLESGTMSFFCTCPYEERNKMDFKAILDTIEYRI